MNGRASRILRKSRKGDKHYKRFYQWCNSEFKGTILKAEKDWANKQETFFDKLKRQL